MLAKRTFRKLNSKQSWFKNKPLKREEENEKERREREQTMTDKFQKAGNSVREDPKAGTLVPYTHNSALVKELRQVEDVMEKLTGTRLKIVEKAGIQLTRILVKSNPWSGSNCQREESLI